MIPTEVRQQIRAIYAFRCGYCGVAASEAGVELTIDHYCPRSFGGTDDPENLVYPCHAGNGYKGASWDPEVPLILHPLRDDLNRHFSEEPSGNLVPLTEAGRRHIETLHLNRAPLHIRRRDVCRLQSLLERQKTADTRLNTIETAIAEFKKPARRGRKRQR